MEGKEEDDKERRLKRERRVSGTNARKMKRNCRRMDREKKMAK